MGCLQVNNAASLRRAGRSVTLPEPPLDLFRTRPAVADVRVPRYSRTYICALLSFPSSRLGNRGPTVAPGECWPKTSESASSDFAACRLTNLAEKVPFSHKDHFFIPTNVDLKPMERRGFRRTPFVLLSVTPCAVSFIREVLSLLHRCSAKATALRDYAPQRVVTASHA